MRNYSRSFDAKLPESVDGRKGLIYIGVDGSVYLIKPTSKDRQDVLDADRDFRDRIGR